MAIQMAPWLKDGDTLPIGDAVELDASLLRSLAVLKDGKGNVQARAKGIMLADDRRSVRVRVGDLPVTYTVALSIIRDPLTPEEVLLVEEQEELGKARKTQKLETAERSTAALIAGVKRETVELAEAKADAKASARLAEANGLKPVIDGIRAFADAGLFSPVGR